MIATTGEACQFCGDWHRNSSGPASLHHKILPLPDDMSDEAVD
jgi:hypothetical protein